MRNSAIRWILGIVILFIGIYVIYKVGFAKYLTLENMKLQGQYLKHFVENNYNISVAVYMFLYFFVIASSIPASGPMSILGGFLFGVTRGVLYATIAAVFGATVAFLLFRTVFRKNVTFKYSKQLDKFKKGLDEYGAFYLLILNFLFVLPFFVITTLAALANVSLFRFVWTTAVGFLPCAIIYSLAGKQLATIASFGDILSFRVIGTLALLIGFIVLAMVFKKLRRSIKI